ncbi:Imm61 family immunity protein [Mycolicibacterium sp. P1-5]|uniref:Imm61 family immunity protein n=1 Tax=Mycolicibacterium sp. P1-5 TaxID=2024617 RepID=UPI001883239D
MEPREQFEVASISASLIERWIVAYLARSIRSLSGLPRLAHPRTAADISVGYSFGMQRFLDKDRYVLVDPQGPLTAVVSGGKLTGTMQVVYLSVLASNTLDVLEQSFMDPEGKPLLEPRNTVVTTVIKDRSTDRTARSQRRYLRLPQELPGPKMSSSSTTISVPELRNCGNASAKSSTRHQN